MLYPPLGLASVVELEPLDIAEVSRYLCSKGPAGGLRWDRVTEQVRLAPQGTLARVLSLPLMVYLVGIAYGALAADPADLIEISSSGQLAVEDHLLDLLIPTLYRDRPAKDLVNENLAKYSPGQVSKWLTFLACHLEKTGSLDLAWWRLMPAIENWRRISRLAFGLLYGATIGLAVGFLFGLYYGIAAGTLYGCIIGFVYGSDDSATPQRVSFNMTAIVAHFRDNWTGCVMVGVAVGLATGLVDGLFAPVRSATTAALAFGGVTVLLYGLLSGLRAPLDVVHAIAPRSVLQSDRAAVFLCRLVPGAAYASLGAALISPSVGMRDGIVFGLAVALLQGFVARLAFKRIGRETAGSMSGGAWFRFSVARCWLAVRGDLPWRLMGFLSDARARGLLRQSGASYQFRHPRLRERVGDAGVAANGKPGGA